MGEEFAARNSIGRTWLLSIPYHPGWVWKCLFSAGIPFSSKEVVSYSLCQYHILALSGRCRIFAFHGDALKSLVVSAMKDRRNSLAIWLLLGHDRLMRPLLAKRTALNWRSELWRRPITELRTISGSGQAGARSQGSSWQAQGRSAGWMLQDRLTIVRGVRCSRL